MVNRSVLAITNKLFLASFAFINELQVAMRGTMYYNNDDIMTDYFDSAYFMGINIGKYNKPYKLTETS